MSILQTRLNSLLSTFTVPPEKRGDLHWLNENIAFKKFWPYAFIGSTIYNNCIIE